MLSLLTFLCFLPFVSAMHWNMVEKPSDDDWVVLEESGTYWRDQDKQRRADYLYKDFDPFDEEDSSFPLATMLRVLGISLAINQMIFIALLSLEIHSDYIETLPEDDEDNRIRLVDLPSIFKPEKKKKKKKVKGSKTKTTTTEDEKKSDKPKPKPKKVKKKKDKKMKKKVEKEKTKEENTVKSKETVEKTTEQLNTAQEESFRRSMKLRRHKSHENTRTMTAATPNLRRRPSKTKTQLTQTVATAPLHKDKQQLSNRLPRAEKGNQTALLADMEDFLLGAEAEQVENETRNVDHAKTKEETAKGPGEVSEKDLPPTANEKEKEGQLSNKDDASSSGQPPHL